MDNDSQRSVSLRAARRTHNQHTKGVLLDTEGGISYGGKLSQEYAMKIIWKKGFVRLILMAGILWMLLILAVLLFHIWTCQSSVASFAALCNKDSKVFGMLNNMGLVTPPHRCPIPVADDPEKITIPKERNT
ncbi:hypothetical protein Sango_0877500 [Sesamum angolense]|uniref:Uncharacterized protein n=1 Tax=Sesamum angolense TaxID=2727404 RepID=A0AAE1WXZ1_9LAMI|nr:hypothetical protein Sango_0877500 [Sesamum angolense]